MGFPIAAKTWKYKWFSLAGVATTYWVAARLGLYFSLVHVSVTALWPPSGLALACLFLMGRWVAPAIFLSAFAANYSHGTPLLVSLGIGAGNTLAAIAGAELLHRVRDFRPDFSRIRDIAIFVLIAGAIDPLVSATIGTASLGAGGLLGAQAPLLVWSAWWAGDAIGILIVAPILLLIFSEDWKWPATAQLLEFLLLAVLFLAMVNFVITRGQMFLFLINPFFVWAALRFRNFGVMGLALILAFVSIPVLIVHVAPTLHLDHATLLFLVYRLQLFLVTITIAGLILSAEITSRNRTEADLAKKEEQLRLIFSNSPDHLLIQDKDLRFTFVANPQLGLTEAEMLGKTERDFLPGPEAEALMKTKREIMASGKPRQVELALHGRQGKLEYFEGSYVPRRDASGKVDGLLGYFRNVTERKESEKSVAALREAESSNRAKDQFIATLSHELRTPLTAILAWVQLIKTGKSDPASQAAGIQAIEDSALTQSQLINDLVDVSRIVTGKLVLKPEAVEVRTVLQRALDTILLSAQKKSISISENYASGSFEVLADPTRLKQIFWNILSNSVKFTPPGGKITASLTAEDSNVVVTFADTGQGLAPELLPTLFRRFSQGDSSTTRTYGGMGIGLSLCHSLLELQGGSIRAVSAGPGQGSTFTVTLPRLCSAAAAKPASPREQRPASLAHLNILVVEDELLSRQAIEATLTAFGAKTETAASAQEAFTVLQHFPANVILSDLSMPREDGYSFLRRLRAAEESRLRSIPAIAFSALAGPEVQKAAMDAGFQAHLPKPIDIYSLVEKIAQIANQTV